MLIIVNLEMVRRPTESRSDIGDKFINAEVNHGGSKGRNGQQLRIVCV